MTKKGQSMSKVVSFFVCLILVSGFFVGTSNAQNPYVLQTTAYNIAEATSYGGSTTGFAIITANWSGGNSRLYVYKVEVIDLDTTANTVSVYFGRTLASATIKNDATVQFLGSVTYADSTTVVRGTHVGMGQGAVADVLARAGTAYLGDHGAVFDCTMLNGRPTKVDGVVVKATSGIKPFSVRVWYFKE